MHGHDDALTTHLQVPIQTKGGGGQVFFEHHTSSLVPLEQSLGITPDSDAESQRWLQPDAATGEWKDSGESLCLVFKDDEVAYFGESEDGVGSVMKRGPFRMVQHFYGGPERVDGAFGPVSYFERARDGRLEQKKERAESMSCFERGRIGQLKTVWHRDLKKTRRSNIV